MAEVKPRDLETVTVAGQNIPIKGPDCRLCARMATCDIYKQEARFFNEVYPILYETRGDGREPLPENKQIRPFPVEALAKICKYYAPATKPDPLHA
jgi:hypothetical protein